MSAPDNRAAIFANKLLLAYLDPETADEAWPDVILDENPSIDDQWLGVCAHLTSMAADSLVALVGSQEVAISLVETRLSRLLGAPSDTQRTEKRWR
jgi:hypothetical protein